MEQGRAAGRKTNLHQNQVYIKSSLTFKIYPHFSRGDRSHRIRSSRKSAPVIPMLCAAAGHVSSVVL